MPIGGNGQVIGYDERAIRWDGNNGFIFENPSNMSLHSALPHYVQTRLPNHLKDSHYEKTRASVTCRNN